METRDRLGGPQGNVPGTGAIQSQRFGHDAERRFTTWSGNKVRTATTLECGIVKRPVTPSKNTKQEEQPARGGCED